MTSTDEVTMNAFESIADKPQPEKQGKYEGFDNSHRPSNLTQIRFTSSIFQPVWPWNLMDDLTK